MLRPTTADGNIPASGVAAAAGLFKRRGGGGEKIRYDGENPMLECLSCFQVRGAVRVKRV